MGNFKTNASVQLLTAAQMRALEQAVIDSGTVTGLELMERAGRGVVAAVFEEWPELAAAPRCAVVLCGPGNNGGDGFVVARVLKEWGWEVEVFALGTPGAGVPDAAENRRRWDGPVRPLEEIMGEDILGADLVVDALFGTGLARGFAPPPTLGMAFHTMFEDGVWSDGVMRTPRVAAVDIVSGLDADSGRVLKAAEDHGWAMAAHLTVTFHAPKLGHVLAEGPFFGGALAVVDIGLRAPEPSGAMVLGVGAPMSEEVGETLSKGAWAQHKYDHGHALVVSGPMGRSGAARLAARAALRVGAGVVTVAAPGSAMLENACQLTAIMLRRCDGAEGLAELLADERISALCLGPGAGLGEGTVAQVETALAVAARRGLAVVLDADALSAFADTPERLFAAARAAGGVVMTPHDGEFARIFPDLAARLAAPPTAGPAWSRVDATRAAAERAGAVVVLKGPDTVIAAPGGAVRVHASVRDRAAPWLATAGSGDVLAGMIAGLMARGTEAALAARMAVWLHVEAARAFGAGLIAEDLPEALPGVLRDLGIQAATVRRSAEASSSPSA